MVPKLYVTLPTCLLRVVDNDSGEELTRVFQKVAPNNLKKNKVTYSVNYFIQRETERGREQPSSPKRVFSSVEERPRSESEALGFDSSWGLRIFSLSHNLEKTEKTSLCKVVIVL